MKRGFDVVAVYDNDPIAHVNQSVRRLHFKMNGCLFDAGQNVFSASSDVLTGVEQQVRLPGGVLESWFFVTAGRG